MTRYETNNISSSIYTKILRDLYLRQNRWWMTLIVVVCLSMLFIDERFMIAGLLILIVAFPMVLALIYFNYALTLESRWSILEKDITEDNHGLTLRFIDERMPPVTIKNEDITTRTISHNCLIIILRHGKYRFLAIPLDKCTFE